MLNKGLVELRRIDQGEDVGEGLGARNAIGNLDPFLEPLEVFVTKFLDVSEAVHAAENFTKVVFFVSASARFFDDRKGLEALRKTAGAINFVEISSHPASVHIPDMVYIFKSN